MESAKIKVETVMVVPQYTAEEWELFSCSMDCSEAVKALNLCLIVGAQDIVANGASVSDAYTKHCYPVMRSMQNFGALDTEPRGVMWDTLRKFFVGYPCVRP